MELSESDINKNINWYEKYNNITYLNIRNKKGEETQALIDAEDMERTKEVRWSMYWDEDIQNYYIRSTKYLGIIDGKARYETILLHRHIMNAKKGDYIDHINHNSLDNRKDNLRATTNNKNVKNRTTKNKNNKSGYRNVSWDNWYKKWKVQLQVEGKNTVLDMFDDVDEAGEYAAIMREKYYGEFAGDN